MGPAALVTASIRSVPVPTLSLSNTPQLPRGASWCLPTRQGSWVAGESLAAVAGGQRLPRRSHILAEAL